MSHIAQNINELRSRIPSDVKLVAVSKTKTITEIREAMDAGIVYFGESKVQELTAKRQHIPNVQWHQVGHLQTNKVKYIAPFVHMIQSVDSYRILEEINRQAKKHNRVIDCLLQVHIAKEESKFGFSEDEIVDLLEDKLLQHFNHVRLCGLMGMATFTDDMEAVRKEFRGLADFFRRIREKYFSEIPSFCELSMGMSDDYPIAIEEGATIVRIGSTIFGNSNIIRS